MKSAGFVSSLNSSTATGWPLGAMKLLPLLAAISLAAPLCVTHSHAQTVEPSMEVVLPRVQNCDSVLQQFRLERELYELGVTVDGPDVGEAVRAQLLTIAAIPYPSKPVARQQLGQCLGSEILSRISIMKAAAQSHGPDSPQFETARLLVLDFQSRSKLFEVPDDIADAMRQYVVDSYQRTMPLDDWQVLLDLTEATSTFQRVVRYEGQIPQMADPLRKAEYLYAGFPSDPIVQSYCSELLLRDLPLGGVPPIWDTRNTRALWLAVNLDVIDFDELRTMCGEQLSRPSGLSWEMVKEIAHLLRFNVIGTDGVGDCEFARLNAFAAHLNWIAEQQEDPAHPFPRTYPNYCEALRTGSLPALGPRPDEQGCPESIDNPPLQ